MRQRASRLWKAVWSREGALSLVVTVAGALALGLLPNLAESVPKVGESGWTLALLAIVAVLLCALAALILRAKPGVGIVVYLGGDAAWDRTRLHMMQRDAMRRHATCFTVVPASLLRGLPVADHVTLAFRVLQARLEETPTNSDLPESVSFYVTARHPDAYRLGGLLRAQLHEDVALMDSPPERHGPAITAGLVGMSEERGQRMFLALRLDSGLKRPPNARDLELLRPVLADPENPPPFRRFTVPDNVPAPCGTALIVAMADNRGMVSDALAAAEHGESPVYEFPAAGTPESRRCAGALVVETELGNLPDRTEVHEAFVRYVVQHWRDVIADKPFSDPCFLFTDGPVSTVVAFGAMFGRTTRLIPHRRPGSPARPPQTPRPGDQT